MFCLQCEQTRRTDAALLGPEGGVRQGRSHGGSAGRAAPSARGIGQYRKRLGALRRPDREPDSFVLSALFTTMINVNFDDARLPPARSRTCWTDPLRSYESNISHPMVIVYV